MPTEGQMDVLAVSLLGLRFSGTSALVAVVLVIVAIGAVWYLAKRRR